MSKSAPLSQFFRIKPRFARSVNIVHDYADERSLDGYIVTPLARSILGRLASSLSHQGRSRAWSITGPYGTGKSACCLFMSSCLSPPADVMGKKARAALRRADSGLFKQAFSSRSPLARTGLVPVLVGGSRRPIVEAIMEAMESTASTALGSGKNARRLKMAVSRGLRDTTSGKDVPAERIVELLVELAKGVASKKGNLGLVLVIDELGKLLEYAAVHPDRSDVFVLQALAEAASRSGRIPMLIVTVLHQAFDRYAAHLGSQERQEWAKVQGRFEDVGFLEPRGQLLGLVSSAIERRACPSGVEKAIGKEVSRALSLGVLSNEWHTDCRLALDRCAPLHPLAALVLGPLFRGRLSQNERSLFAFLSAKEPNGFQAFLDDPRNAWNGNRNCPFYSVDLLYDYVIAAMGSGLMVHDEGKRWAEIAAALDRVKADAVCGRRLIKSIGMLGILGDNRFLKASARVLQASLANGAGADQRQVAPALAELEKARVIVYRRHSDSYSLWEGSDVDLNERFRAGLGHVDIGAGLLEHLNRSVELAPFVAKRHLFETGTLRYFRPEVVGEERAEQAILSPLGSADGLVVFVIPRTSASEKKLIVSMRRKSKGLPSPLRQQVLVAIPRGSQRLLEVVRDVMAWEWVAKNTPALEGDRIARKELSARYSDAQQRLENACAGLFTRDAAYRSCTWVHEGRVRPFHSARAFAGALSDICDVVFAEAPRIHNELINRRTLSSAAAAARRALMSRMLAQGEFESLGIEKTPPEKSMYVSVLRETGLHHRSGKRWAFGVPKSGDRAKIKPLWSGIDRLLTTAKGGRVPVAELLHRLSQPPWGVREGLLPVLLLTRILAGPHEFAMYENGSFVPEHDAPLFERLVKSPDSFAVQFCRVAGARRSLFERFARLAGGDVEPNKATLVSAMRPAYSFYAGLTSYVRNTKNLTDHAGAVRDALKAAREPHKVLFGDLPQAVGIPPIRLRATDAAVSTFLARIKEAFRELNLAYVRLLDRIEDRLRDLLLLPETEEEARRVARSRALAVADVALDLRVKAFAMRLADAHFGRMQWLESVAACVLAKPPSEWVDADEARYHTRLTELAKGFLLLEEARTASTLHEPLGRRTIALDIADSQGKGFRKVVRYREEDGGRVAALAEEAERALKAACKDRKLTDAAIAELALRMSASGQEENRE